MLAKGVRAGFHDQALAAVPVLFAKFKEKRLTEEILTSLGHLMMCIELGEIVECFNAAKTEKVPLTKTSIMKFME